MLETKTVCSFEIFKTGKQNNASVFTVFCSLSRRSEPKILNGRNVHGPCRPVNQSRFKSARSASEHFVVAPEHEACELCSKKFCSLKFQKWINAGLESFPGLIVVQLM